jgi:hypothetical protein
VRPAPRAAHNAGVVEPLLVAASLVIGFGVARWWVLSVPAALCVYVAAVSEVDEVPPWFLAFCTDC